MGAMTIEVPSGTVSRDAGLAYAMAVLRAQGGNRTKAAEVLGVARGTVKVWCINALLAGMAVPDGKRGGRGPDRGPRKLRGAHASR